MPGSVAGAEEEVGLLSDAWCMVLAGSRASMAAQVDDAFTAKKEALKVSPLPSSGLGGAGVRGYYMR